MKRDLMVVYRILEKVEKSEYDFSDAPIPIILPGVAQETLQYHFLILEEAGLIETISNDKGVRAPTRLTWKGHDYLDHASDVVISSVPNVFAEVN